MIRKTLYLFFFSLIFVSCNNEIKKPNFIFIYTAKTLLLSIKNWLNKLSIIVILVHLNQKMGKN